MPVVYQRKYGFAPISRILPGRPPASRSTRIGTDFNEIAHALLTPGIRADLRNLSGFRFKRDTEYVLPEDRLRILENVVISHM